MEAGPPWSKSLPNVQQTARVPPAGLPALGYEHTTKHTTCQNPQLGLPRWRARRPAVALLEEHFNSNNTRKKEMGPIENKGGPLDLQNNRVLTQVPPLGP